MYFIEADDYELYLSPQYKNKKEIKLKIRKKMTPERAKEIKEKLIRTATSYDWNHDEEAVNEFSSLIDELIESAVN